MAENSFQPFTRRQTMIRRDFEIYRYRYMDEVELHHHDFMKSTCFCAAVYLIRSKTASSTCARGI